MEHGPLPPYERRWRHPSEVAAEERALLRAEPMPSTSRALALTTGSLGLFAIAMLFVLVTPARHSAPVAVSATTSPGAAHIDGDDSTAAILSARGAGGPTSATTQATQLALATPIGSGHYAIVLRASLGGDGDVLEVMLPSGRRTKGDLVDTAVRSASAAVLIHLDDHEPGPQVADRRPHERDVVTVMASPPITVALADLGNVDVADGTAVVDASGALVGLCTGRRGGGTELVDVPSDVDVTIGDEDDGAGP